MRKLYALVVLKVMIMASSIYAGGIIIAPGAGNTICNVISDGGFGSDPMGSSVPTKVENILTMVSADGSGGTISPADLPIEDILNGMESQEFENLKLLIKRLDSQFGTDIIATLEPFLEAKNFGNFEILAVDPEVYAYLKPMLENTPDLNSVQIEEFDNSLSVNVVHADEAGRFIIFETEKTQTDLAGVIIVAPVPGL